MTPKETTAAAYLSEAVKTDQLLTPKGVKELLAKNNLADFFAFERDKYGEEFLDFSRCSNKHFYASFTRQLQNVFGHARINRMNGVFPLSELARTKNKWVPGLSEYGYHWGAMDDEGDPIGVENQSAEIAMILKVLETRIKDIEEAV